jgi:hypothetical protein
LISSTEDALRLLTKWKNDEHPLLVDFSGKGFAFSCKGKVSEVSSDTLRISGKTTKLEISLDSASFVYSEPREAPPDVKVEWELKVICCLVTSLPSGEECYMYELWMA